MTTKTKGLILAFSAYILWGVLSRYWKQLGAIPAHDIFAYRILWTVVTMLLYMGLSGQSKKFTCELTNLWKTKTIFWRMVLASVLITVNWLSYIWAVTHGQATEASLGYYVMPLIFILLSVIFLKETLSNFAKLAIALYSLKIKICYCQVYLDEL